MPYSQEISRANKALFVFLLDQSGSMEEPLGISQRAKMDELAVALNGWLANMTIRVSGSEGIKDWMDIGLIGYRTDMRANPIIESPLGGVLHGRLLNSIVELGNSPAMTRRGTRKFWDDETGEQFEAEVAEPVWIEPKAEGGTPMCNALHHAHDLVKQWIQRHPTSFPPIVVNFTDGDSQDGDPIPYAELLRGLETCDGNVLLFNCCLSASDSSPFLFPHTDEILPDGFARMLFHMSSFLPDPLYEAALSKDLELEPGARGLAYNADMRVLLSFIDMGTRITNSLR